MECRIKLSSGVVLTVKHISGEIIASTDESSCPLASALCRWRRISDEDVATVKKALAIKSSAKIKPALTPEQDTLLAEVHGMLTTLASMGHNMPVFPFPNGTRSAESMVASVCNDEKDYIGFVVFTSLWPDPTKNAVWLCLDANA